MAQKTTNSSSSSTTTTRSSFWGLNKISFYTIGTAAVLYLIAAIFTLINATTLVTVARIMSGIATAIMVCIVSVLAWKYVRNKTTVWKVLYFVFLALVILGIIIPLIKG